MRRLWLVVGMVIASGLSSGCRCCSLMHSYASAVDDVSDSHLHFDNWYHPRWDISRAGKPDWCGDNGRQRSWYCCREGTWGRYDDCNLYPTSYPYSYSGTAFLSGGSPVPSTPAPAVAEPYEKPMVE